MFNFVNFQFFILSYQFFNLKFQILTVNSQIVLNSQIFVKFLGSKFLNRVLELVETFTKFPEVGKVWIRVDGRESPNSCARVREKKKILPCFSFCEKLLFRPNLVQDKTGTSKPFLFFVNCPGPLFSDSFFFFIPRRYNLFCVCKTSKSHAAHAPHVSKRAKTGKVRDTSHALRGRWRVWAEKELYSLSETSRESRGHEGWTRRGLGRGRFCRLRVLWVERREGGACRWRRGFGRGGLHRSPLLSGKFPGWDWARVGGVLLWYRDLQAKTTN